MYPGRRWRDWLAAFAGVLAFALIADALVLQKSAVAKFALHKFAVRERCAAKRASSKSCSPPRTSRNLACALCTYRSLTPDNAGVALVTTMSVPGESSRKEKHKFGYELQVSERRHLGHALAQLL